MCSDVDRNQSHLEIITKRKEQRKRREQGVKGQPLRDLRKNPGRLSVAEVGVCDKQSHVGHRGSALVDTASSP